MRAIWVVCWGLAWVGAAVAQVPVGGDGARPGNIIGTGMSLPRSDSASNLNAATTRSDIAPNLPTPQGSETIGALLREARRDLVARQTGAAQEALERAETRVLDRSVPYGTQDQPASDMVTGGVTAARAALAAGDMAGAIAAIDAVLPRVGEY